MTLTPVAKRLIVDLSLSALTAWFVPTGDRIPVSCVQGERSTTKPPRRSTLSLYFSCSINYELVESVDSDDCLLLEYVVSDFDHDVE